MFFFKDYKCTFCTSAAAVGTSRLHRLCTCSFFPLALQALNGPNKQATQTFPSALPWKRAAFPPVRSGLTETDGTAERWWDGMENGDQESSQRVFYEAVDGSGFRTPRKMMNVIRTCERQHSARPGNPDFPVWSVQYRCNSSRIFLFFGPKSTFLALKIYI